MMSIEAMKQAIEALQKNHALINGTERFLGLDQIKDTYYAGCFDVEGINKQTNDAITALRAAIEQAEKQRLDQNLSDQSLAIRTRQYANGAQAGWDLAIAGDSVGLRHLEDFARAVEARLTHTTKTWFDGEKVVTQEIPESEIYKQEPVAWLYVNADMPTNRQLEWTETHHGYAGNWRKYPLYVAPPAAQEPVAYKWKGELFTPGEIEMLDVDDAVPLYEHPRKWVGLKDEDIKALYDMYATYQEYDAWESGWFEFAGAVQTKLKELNT